MSAMGPADWNQRYEQSELIWGAGANRTLVAEVGTMVPGRALDFGCGEGRNAVWLASQGWTTTGVDFSKGGLGKARRLAEAEGVAVEWELADLRTYTPRPTPTTSWWCSTFTSLRKNAGRCTPQRRRAFEPVARHSRSGPRRVERHRWLTASPRSPRFSSRPTDAGERRAIEALMRAVC